MLPFSPILGTPRIILAMHTTCSLHLYINKVSGTTELKAADVSNASSSLENRIRAAADRVDDKLLPETLIRLRASVRVSSCPAMTNVLTTVPPHR